MSQLLPCHPVNGEWFFSSLLGLSLGILLCLARTWIWARGVLAAGVYGFAVGSALLPALIAYAIAGRKKARNFNRFAFWFCALSVVFFLIEVSRRPPDLKLQVADLMREAAGTKAVKSSGSPMDTVMRDMMRDVLAQRKAFETERAHFATALTELYGVESFSTRSSMQRTLDAVRGIWVADQQYSRQMESLPGRFQQQVDRASLSDSEKRNFMSGVDSGLAKSTVISARQRAMELEAQWADATITLYDFALANSTKISMQDSHLVIANEKIRTQFIQQMERARALGRDWDSAAAQVQQAEREAYQQVGLAPKDLGLQGGNPAPSK